MKWRDTDVNIYLPPARTESLSAREELDIDCDSDVVILVSNYTFRLVLHNFCSRACARLQVVCQLFANLIPPSHPSGHCIVLLTGIWHQGSYFYWKLPNPAYLLDNYFLGLSTLLPKPAAAPAAHSILKNGAVAASSYVPVYEKQKPVLGPGSASPYSTLSRDLSRPGSSMSNGKPEPTPWVYCLDKIPKFNSGLNILQ